VKKLLIAVIAALSLLVVPSASAQQYNHYINCGTGAYIYSYDLVWVGGHWEQRNVQITPIWGRC
jgi:hypothetical protein